MWPAHLDTRINELEEQVKRLEATLAEARHDVQSLADLLKRKDEAIQRLADRVLGQSEALTRKAEKGRDWFADVLEFHRAFGVLISPVPRIPPWDVRQLRFNLENEEWRELMEGEELGCIPDIADAIVDLIYVLIGRAVCYGVDLRPLWDAVHRANMSKLGPDGKPIRREDGKVIKPEGWKPPDISALIVEQMEKGEGEGLK